MFLFEDQDVNILICQYCGRECKNLNSLRNHERLCKENPNHQESPLLKHNEKIRSGERVAWNKGLTKDDERIRHNIESHKYNLETGKTKPSWLGKHHTEETKQKLSIAQTNYLIKNNLNRWSNGHSHKRSYAENYFYDILSKYCIEQYSLEGTPYRIDFANIKNKIAIEIDGEQHYNLNGELIEHDKIRDKNLLKLGWQTIRIRWSNFKKLTNEEKEKFIENLILKINF